MKDSIQRKIGSFNKSWKLCKHEIVNSGKCVYIRSTNIAERPAYLYVPFIRKELISTTKIMLARNKKFNPYHICFLGINKK